MAQYKLTIVSPRDKVFDSNADLLSAPGSEGEFGVLAHHAPMVALVKRGITRVTVDGQVQLFVTGNGFVEVTHEEVNMLTDYAVRAGSMEEAREMLAQHLKDVGDTGVLLK